MSLEEWQAWLSGAPSPDEDSWQAFAALPEEQRDQLLNLLRAEVLQAVRTSPPAALPLANCLVHASRGMDAWGGLAPRTLGVALHFNGRSQEAVEHFSVALAWYEEHDEQLEAARVQRSLVDVYQMSGNSERALELAAAARTTFETRGERTLLAQLECNVGNVHFRLDRYGAAREHYDRAVAEFSALGDDFGEAHALFNLGNIETNAHRFAEAQSSFLRARDSFKRAGHAVLAADCDYSMAYLELRRGRLGDARRGLEYARDSYLEGGKPSGPALCDMDLCELHLRMDACRDAVRLGARALGEMQELDLDYERAKVRLFTGLAHARLGDSGPANESLVQAEKELRSLGNRTLAALAILHRLPLDPDNPDAPDLVEQAACDLEESGDDLLSQLASLARAESYLRAGQRHKGLVELERLVNIQADESLLELGLANVRIEGLRLLASNFREAGRVEEAEGYLREAVGWIEQTLTTIEGADARIAFFSRRQPAFTELATLLLDEENRRAPEAIDLVERSRERNREKRGRAASTPEMEQIRSEIDALMRADMDQLLETPAGQAGESAEAKTHRQTRTQRRREDLGRLRAELLQLRRELHGDPEESPSFAPDAAPIVAGERALYFVESGNLLYGMLLAPGSPGDSGDATRVESVRQLAISASDVREHTSRMRFQVGKYRHGRAYSERHAEWIRASIDASLAFLGQALLEPFADGLELAEGSSPGPLVVIPFGVLHEVPFAGLRVRGRALVQWTDVSIARSLRQLRERRPARLPGRDVLTCIDTADDLPAIAREREALAAWQESTSHELAVEDFLERLGGGAAPVVHLAAHGSYEPDHPQFSGVRLGSRFLTAYDIAGFQLPGSLVLLSGCETGRQANPAGEELYGPEQAFLGAGARGVVSCLWPVGDEAGASWISRMGEELAAGASVRTAVSCAQRHAIDSGAPPQDWAGFLYSGDPDLALPVASGARAGGA